MSMNRRDFIGASLLFLIAGCAQKLTPEQICQLEQEVKSLNRSLSEDPQKVFEEEKERSRHAMTLYFAINKETQEVLKDAEGRPLIGGIMTPYIKGTDGQERRYKFIYKDPMTVDRITEAELLTRGDGEAQHLVIFEKMEDAQEAIASLDSWKLLSEQGIICGLAATAAEEVKTTPYQEGQYDQKVQINKEMVLTVARKYFGRGLSNKASFPAP